MSQARVLVVDDDRDFADSLAEALEQQGHRVTVSYTGEDALRRLQHCSFDITFLDFMLPGKHGVEVFFDLRDLHPAGKVMLMTGYSKQSVLERALAGGALGVLDKPLDIDQVLAAVDRASPDGTVLLVDDEPDFVESMSAVLRASGHHVLTAGNGRDAIALAREQTIDVLVLDLRMPELDGLEVYSQLQALGLNPATIVVTGYMEEEADSLRALTLLCKANALIKPFDPEILLDEVQQLISG